MHFNSPTYAWNWLLEVTLTKRTLDTFSSPSSINFGLADPDITLNLPSLLQPILRPALQITTYSTLLLPPHHLLTFMLRNPLVRDCNNSTLLTLDTGN